MMQPKLLLPTSYFLLRKSLLAFSGGVDSSALFFLLLEHDIPFDIALVNYGTREQSDAEEAHAKALAARYGLKCHTAKAPRFTGNFEKHARDFRYDFFEDIIAEYGYDTLMTAHQLNDRMEWFLMRLTRGAGVRELTGMASVEEREGYTLVRPLLTTPRSDLLDYLHRNGYPFFIDDSNTDSRFERNRFRADHVDRLIEDYGEGIARSFDYLEQDKAVLDSLYGTLFACKQLRILRLHHPDARVPAADATLKTLGYLLSAAQRREIAKQESLVIGRLWAVERRGDLLYIAPYRTDTMPKHFKEQCRQHGIPAKIRPYLYAERIDPGTITLRTGRSGS